MRLLAISDLHVANEENRRLVEEMPAHPDDWLVLAGDVGETEAHLGFVLRTLGPRFRQLIWVPGNHELWTPPREPGGARGEERYLRMVELCRGLGVLTPEDPYVIWPGRLPAKGRPCVIVPMHILYDYTFRPDDIPVERAIDWAMETNVLCVDEMLLHPAPYPSRAAWCAARCAYTEARLGQIPQSMDTVLINHFPLIQEHARLPRVPRFSIWCGTRRTGDWHRRFRARVVVYGHLHIRRSHLHDGVRFEEVSLGYPRQWSPERGPAWYLREILPGPGPSPDAALFAIRRTAADGRVNRSRDR